MKSRFTAQAKILVAASVAVALAASAGIAGSNLTVAERTSFKSVVDRVFANPIHDPNAYPIYAIFPPFLVQAVLGIMHVPGIELVERLRETTTEATDLRDPRVKVIHSTGICAGASWEVSESSPYTGLFAQGTRARAIVRFSTGNNLVGFSRIEPRIFGFAVKVFPTRDPKEPVYTANLFTMDQYGLDGDVRRRFLVHKDGTDSSELLRFGNEAVASGPARLALLLFGRFDSRPEVRPLYAFSEVTGDGRGVESPVTPERIEFIPAGGNAGSRAKPVNGDFRTEFAAYEPGELEFRMIVDRFELGRLRIGRTVVSTACDQELHFHHHPTR